MRSFRSAALLALAVLGTLHPIRAQMSPGPLASPHRELDTPLNCFVCHGKAKGDLNPRCLDCHQEIAWLIEHDRGYHAPKKADTCASCHPDHAGRDFAMVKWPGGRPEAFDHKTAGWPLEGKHAAIKCRDCHTAKYDVSPAAKKSKRKDPGDGWVGLEPACTSCHEDIHRGTLSPDCLTCHDVNAWKPAPRFDHAKTSYPLTGTHAPVPCAKCHTVAGQEKLVYKPIPHEECTPCHVDAHAGQLGPACAKCHVTDSWRTVATASFDHDKTKYPLRGKHVAVKCAQCHDPQTAWGKKPPFALCGACHKDAHAGAATIQGRLVDCAACHKVDGWKVDTFTVAEHDRSAYPLAGRHRTVACEACHLKNPSGVAAGSLGSAGVQLRPKFARCLDCHRDDHAGQLAKREGAGACEPCHDVAGWKPSLYGAEQHAKLSLPLDGRHGKIACAACHGPARNGLPPLAAAEKLGKAGVALVLGRQDCAACHFDAHSGRFGPGGAKPKPDGCPTCHNVAAFRPSIIDVAAHGGFAYPLDGAHRAVSCDACHVESKIAPGPARSSLALTHGPAPPMTFATKGTGCEACHQNPHGDQFARRSKGGACATCHGEASWKPASKFDHDVDAAFSLKGAHARVPCAKCHASLKAPAGTPVVVYRPVPHACEDCHGKRIPGGAA
jgi:hypothetical protein